MPSETKETEEECGYTPMCLEQVGGYTAMPLEDCTPFRGQNGLTGEATSELEYEGSSYVDPASQDLRGRPMPIQTSRSRTASTAERMKEGSPKQANRFRLRTRSDLQDAVRFLEGAAVPKQDENDPQDPEVAGDNRGYLLPAGLLGSFLSGVICMLTVQRQCVEAFLGGVSATVFTVSFSLVVLSAFGCMAYAAFVDPGQLLYDVVPLPKRSHKSFQYQQPLMRYDHYCRWLMNCIALKNHREFVIMLICFCISILFDIVVDVISFVWSASQAKYLCIVVIALHLAYSIGFAYLALPIMRLHFGFISRNELANEWKRDLYYIVNDSLTGAPVSVKDLDPEDFNDLFDSFKYDSSRNPWDQGCPKNCWLFWCTPRWEEDDFGEF
mmetsp:Transcript_97285/g.186591  ORF Transcript_97285/g.186591 Transcript_97285/m.186591 type:complete len:383 (+) Transcript_97285:40-1188(+)